MGQAKKEFKVSPLQNSSLLWLLEHMIWDYLNLQMRLGEPGFTWEHVANVL